jgi:hypothetical protein
MRGSPPIIAMVVIVLSTPKAFAQSTFESSKMSPGVVVQGTGLESTKLSPGIVIQNLGMESSKLSPGIVLQKTSFQSSKLSVGIVVQNLNRGVVPRAPLTHW